MFYSHGGGILVNNSTMKLPRLIFTFLFLITFLVLPVSVQALDFTCFDIHSGLLWQIDEPADDETTGAPDPLVTPLGIGTSFTLNDQVNFDPAVFIYGMNYAFQSWDRPRPAQIEQREMYVLNLLLDPAFTFTYTFNNRIDWGFLLSPALILRIPLFPAPGEDAAYGEMLSYFIGPARFFYPGAGLFLDMEVNQILSFRPALRAYLPVFHLWDGDPLLDQLTVFLDLGFRFKLRDKGNETE